MPDQCHSSGSAVDARRDTTAGVRRAERTAEKQYTRELLFSTVYDLMSQVVFCVQPSVRAAYLAHEADVGTSIVSVYNKLNGLETRTSAALVRYSAREFAPLIAQMGGE